MVSMSKNVIKIHWRHDIDEKIKIQSAMWFRRNEQNTSATWFRRKYRLWQPWRNKIDLEVLGLSLFPSPDIDNWMEANPEQQVVTTMQVHQGDQPRLPPSCIASLACVCMIAACPLQIWFKSEKPRKSTIIELKEVLHLFRCSTHTPRCREAFFKFTRSEGYYPFPEAELASKYREESSNELILELTGLHQVMSPCVVPGLSKFL